MAQEHIGTKTPPPAKARRERRVPKRMTLREFLAFDFPEHEKWEYIGGELRMSPSPIGLHQALVLEIAFFLKMKLKNRDYFIVHDSSVLMDLQDSCPEPDVLAYSNGSRIDASKSPFKQVPELAVEVSSPSTAKYDLGDKKALYEAAGVGEYWVADPLTGALTIFVKSKKNGYEQQSGDPDGFVKSPLLKTTFRISRDGNNFKFLEK
jgi:Uma2 family endonuclease